MCIHVCVYVCMCVCMCMYVCKMGGVPSPPPRSTLPYPTLPYPTPQLHGRNRLGGNALSECVVFGLIAGESIPIAAPLAGTASSTDKDKDKDEADKTKDKDKDAKRTISREELEAHATDDSTWVALHGQVYDLTDFLDDHPAGPETITRLAGTDGTDAFAAIHVEGMLADFDFVPLGELQT